MADIKVANSHLTFLGKSYFRGGAPEVEIGSYEAIQNLIDYGDDARIVDTLFVVEAEIAKSFEASKSLSLSVDAGVAKVTAEGGVSGSGSSSITLSKGSTFAYGLVKMDWDANQNENKTKIVKLTDDQWSFS